MKPIFGTLFRLCYFGAVGVLLLGSVLAVLKLVIQSKLTVHLQLNINPTFSTCFPVFTPIISVSVFYYDQADYISFAKEESIYNSTKLNSMQLIFFQMSERSCQVQSIQCILSNVSLCHVKATVLLLWFLQSELDPHSSIYLQNNQYFFVLTLLA